MPVPRGWHPGEVEAQEARGFADELWGTDPPFEDGLPPFYALFFAQLPFIPLATLDGSGRPWASLISGQDGEAGFIQPYTPPGSRSDEDRTLRMKVPAPEGLPLRFCLQEHGSMGIQKGKILAASVGVMLHNRRRNKLEGVVKDWKLDEHAGNLDLELGVNNIMGNCPKYINRRILTSTQLNPKVLASAYPSAPTGTPLPDVALDIVASADHVYLATRHTGNPSVYPQDESRLGMNHRGGRKGFLRHYFDHEQGKSCLVLPDFSGNRFMQSIGNLVHDPVAGLAIPHFGFRSSDGVFVRPARVLHVTGKTQVLVGAEAKKFMRGVQACIKIYVEAYTVLEGALPLAVDGAWSMGTGALSRVHGNEADEEAEGLTEDDCIDWSPYNPPLRLLNSEHVNPSLANLASGDQVKLATLTGMSFWTPTLATFHWSCPVSSVQASGSDTLHHAGCEAYEAGQYVIMDCTGILDTRVKLYKHMAHFPGGEREVNDDGVRSWTVSSRPSFTTGSDGNTLLHFSMTVRRKQRGAVTPGLFHQGWRWKQEHKKGSSNLNITVPMLGFDGVFTVPKPTSSTDPLKLLYMAHGIGITPLLAHLEQLAARQSQSQAEGAQQPVDSLLILAFRADEMPIFDGLLRRALTAQAGNRPGLGNDNPAQFKVRVLYIERPAPDEDQVFSSVTPEMLSALPAPGSESVNITFESRNIPGGRINKHFFLQDEHRLGLAFEDIAKYRAYICGTPAFDKECRKALKLVAAQAHTTEEQTVISESFTF
ncbi:hypothetical protein K437DRAFT_258055 [Tilletiaria anomala UBC 951]|uniref:FAD-binding FR-type domain-containing protein n=1 Tax=Tilletiaria anomala (strain ATCC 24038 / CBS 436.72 / UBC 951) TaxID=1037660 RepID=A0A066VKH6_TILAU|nr:uncharacterized protein K437DRAFT_258055 [Tilletiaria anomala UBC 951]KDN41971.1 hypothetical protein K437DRAFT_258055 [Tilletiaria anomala UBC 951]